ncbi:MAG: hypothetical protein AAF694_18425 [Bacteroidota bacterium]
MKTIKLIFVNLLLIIPMIVSAQEAKPSDSFESVGGSTQENIRYKLLNNRWVLGEIKRVKKDTITNLTVLLQPCERDNYTQYYEDGTYGVFEGENNCSESGEARKGTGTWNFLAEDQIIQDEYQGGREIEKTVLELSETTLKMEFESEGGAKNILTFYTPEAMEKEEIQESIDDPTNIENTLTKMVFASLLEKDRYAVLGKQEFLSGSVPKALVQGTNHKPIVAVYPWMNPEKMEATVDEAERDYELVQQARKAGIEYVVTGKIVSTETSQKNDRYKAEISYTLKFLDARLGNEKGNEVITQKYPNPVKTVIGNVIKVAGVFALATIGFDYAGWYGAARLLDEGSQAINGYEQVFSEGTGDRMEQVEKTNAILSALEESAKDIDKSIDNHLSLCIKILQVSERNKKGKATHVEIDCGAFCKLDPNDKLEVFLGEEILENGVNQFIPKDKLGSLVVESVESFKSNCKIASGAELIAEYLNSTSSLVIALTSSTKKRLGNISFGEKK